MSRVAFLPIVDFYLNVLTVCGDQFLSIFQSNLPWIFKASLQFSIPTSYLALSENVKESPWLVTIPCLVYQLSV